MLPWALPPTDQVHRLACPADRHVVQGLGFWAGTEPQVARHKHFAKGAALGPVHRQHCRGADVGNPTLQAMPPSQSPAPLIALLGRYPSDALCQLRQLLPPFRAPRSSAQQVTTPVRCPVMGSKVRR